MKRYDFVAIGGGNAGLTAAAKVRAAGQSVALIDRGAIGGLCSLNGCNPKKVFVRATELLDEIRRADRFGIEVGEATVDWRRVVERKESFTSPVTPAAEKSLRDDGIDFIQGSPRFVSRNALEVNGGEIEANAFLIATGSTPRRLEFAGAEFVKTSDDILAARQIPKRLVIVGAGVVAFEFGQVFARLGSQVTILAHGRALSNEDEQIVDALVEFSESIGVHTVNEAKVVGVQESNGECTVEFEADAKTTILPADFILNAAGRVASIGSLDLPKAGVETDKHGVVVNEYLRSPSNPAIFAGGDAHGRMQLSPVASYEGRVVARNILEGDVEKADYEGIPRAIYTVPQLASVGLTEVEARKRGLETEVTTSDMKEWKTYAIITAGEVAKAKVITEKGTGRIFGAHLFAPGAGDTINLYALAIKFGIRAEQLRSFVFTYPTLASALPYTF